MEVGTFWVIVVKAAPNTRKVNTVARSMCKRNIHYRLYTLLLFSGRGECVGGEVEG